MPDVLLIASTTRLTAHDVPRNSWPKQRLYFEANLSVTWSTKPDPADDMVAPLRFWAPATGKIEFSLALCHQDRDGKFDAVEFVDGELAAWTPPSQTAVADKLDASLKNMAGDATAQEHLFHWDGHTTLTTNDDPTQPVRPSVDQIVGHLSTQPAAISAALKLSHVVIVSRAAIEQVMQQKAGAWRVALVPTFKSAEPASQPTTTTSPSTQRVSKPFPAAARRGWDRAFTPTPPTDGDAPMSADELIGFDYRSAGSDAPTLRCVTKPVAFTLPPANEPPKPEADGVFHPETMWLHRPAAGPASAHDRDWLGELPAAMAEGMDPLLTLGEALSAEDKDVPPSPDAEKLAAKSAHELLKYAMYVGLFERSATAPASDWVFTATQLAATAAAPGEFDRWTAAVKAVLDKIDDTTGEKPEELTLFDNPMSDQPGELAAMAVRVQNRLSPTDAQLNSSDREKDLRAVVTRLWGPSRPADFKARLDGIAGLRQRLVRDRSERPGLTPARGGGTLPIWATLAAAADAAAKAKADAAGRQLAVAAAAAAELVAYFDHWCAASLVPIDAKQRQWLDARVKGSLKPTANDNLAVLRTPDPTRPPARSVIERRALKLAAQLFPADADFDAEESRCDRPGVQPLVLPLDFAEAGGDDPFRQFAGVGVLIRRSGPANWPARSAADAPGQTDWACLNMAELKVRDLNMSNSSTYVAGSKTDEETRSGPIVAPYRVPYSGQMRTGLPSYNNMPLVAESHVARAVPTAAVSGSPDQQNVMPAVGLDWTIAPVAVVVPTGADAMNRANLRHWAALPALLDGYAYEVASFLIGNTGTLPPVLTAEAGHPAELLPVDRVTDAMKNDSAFAVSKRTVKNYRRVGVGAPRLDPASTTVAGRSSGFAAIPKNVRPLAGDIVHGLALAPGGTNAAKVAEAAVAGREPLLLLAPQAGGAFVTSAAFEVRPPAVDLAMWDRAFGAILARAPDDSLRQTRLDVWTAYYKAAFKHSDTAKTLDDPMACFAGDPSIARAARTWRLRVRWKNEYQRIVADPPEADPQVSGAADYSAIEGGFDYAGHSKPIRMTVTRLEKGTTTKPTAADELVLRLPPGVWKVYLSCELNPAYCRRNSPDRRFAKGVFPDTTKTDFFSSETCFTVEVVPPLAAMYETQRRDLIRSAATLKPRTAKPSTINHWHAEFDRPHANLFPDRASPVNPALNFLPDPDDLWGRLCPVFESGRLRLELTLPDPLVNPAFAFIAGATAALQRWRWHGQPLDKPEWAVDSHTPLDPTAKDNRDTLTEAMKWEVAAFSDRQDSDALTHTVQLPFRGGVAVLSDTPAGDDPRAQYVRLSATVFGRYPRMPGADLPPIGATFVVPAVTSGGTNTPWRRRLIDARPTAPLPPPAVRLVVPLTRGLASSGPGQPGATHSVLVVTDEAWYEKAGLLECLDPAIVKNEQSDGRGGRLPPVDEIGPDPIVTTVLSSGHKLDLVGPVGHTNDVNAGAPRIRASSFVLSLGGPVRPASERDWTFVKLKFRRSILRPKPRSTTVPAASDDPLYVSKYTDPVWVQFLPSANDTPLGEAISRGTALLTPSGKGGPLVLAPGVMNSAKAISERLRIDHDGGFEWWVLLTSVVPGAFRAGRDESFRTVLPLRRDDQLGVTLPPYTAPANDTLLARLIRVQVTRVAGVVQPLVFDASPDATPATTPATSPATPQPSGQSFDAAFWQSLFGMPGDTGLTSKDVRGRIVSVSDSVPGNEAAVEWFADVTERHAESPKSPQRPMPRVIGKR